MKYAVIGAGLSGLAAAHRIAKAGHEVIVIEAQDHAGGRCKMVERDGFIIDTGPEIAASSYHHWLALAKDVGLGGNLVNSPTAIGIVRNGKVIELDPAKPLAMLTTPVLSLTGKLNMLRGGMRLRKRIKAIPPLLLDGAPLDEPGRNGMDIALAAFGREVTERMIDPMLRPIGGTRLDLMSTFMVPYALSEWTRMISLLGGLQRLAIAVAKTLDVRYGMAVDQIRSNADHVAIETRANDGSPATIIADKCLITAQYDDAERIYPRLREISDGYAGKMVYLSMMDVKLAYTKRPTSGIGMVLCPSREIRDICVVSLTHNKAPDRAPPNHALFSISTEHLEFARFNAMTDAKIVETIRPQIEALFPDVAGHLQFAMVCRYPRVSNLPVPGFFHRTRALWDAVGEEPRVHLGGDLFNSGAGMEGAVMSGDMAADRLMAR